MKQEQIKYIEIKKLGFKEKLIEDKVYFNEHGFDNVFTFKNLTKKIYLEWEKETKLCRIVRIDNKHDGNIKGVLPIMNLDHLKVVINFFGK